MVTLTRFPSGLKFNLALSSLPTLHLFAAPPPDVLALVQSILEEFYTDGIDQVISAELNDKGDIVGEFIDQVGARQVKRYKYQIQDNDVAFKLLNPNEVSNFSFESFKPLFGKGSKAGQKKSCRKGTPCGGTCISAVKTCRKAPGSASKAKIQEAKQKLGGKAKTPTEKGGAIAKKAKTKTESKAEPKTEAIADTNSLRRPEKQEFNNRGEVFIRENGRKIDFHTPDSELQYNNLFDTWLGNTDASGAEYGLAARYAALAVAIDPNLSISLPSHGDAGNPMKPEEAKKVFSSLIQQAGTDGEPVVMQIKGKEDREIAAALGLGPAKYSSSLRNDTTELIELESPGIFGEKSSLYFTAKGSEVWIGKKQGDKVVPFTDDEVKKRRIIGSEREKQISELQEHNQWIHDDDFEIRPSKSEQNAFHLKESKRLDSVEALEDNLLGRKPGKTGGYDSYKKKAEKWATETFGDVSAGANGFTLAQTKAHDVAHPITHELLNGDSAGIHKRLGSLKQADGKPSLLGEEAIVNVVEHLSRGDTIEGSILNGLRLARVLSRTGTDEERNYVRSREFKKELVKMAHELYRHDNFSPLIKHVRRSNRESGTVLTGGNDFTNSASGG